MIIFEIHQILDFKCVTWFQDTLMIAYSSNITLQRDVIKT